MPITLVLADYQPIVLHGLKRLDGGGSDPAPG